ncbi:MacB family efflux pump subunit [Pseudocolwellia sp. AS88]|uniref:MacB family efflux pump subunit n=1 Tax=Pseudocolwellia sp. AS88 TaxID=3063958 RepID=UPI0026EA2E35|nr:MacB family efflux pump subunit [Pseudocolwellia sp. AS88]MDO7085576.1 MacB family efflux pump subunit [Pseudocolwellia sp. AS88]
MTNTENFEQPLIELEDIHRTFVTCGGVEVHALRGVSLSIYPGEFLAIMGQSGSGKSTLMNVLGCLDRPTSGSYRFSGKNIKSFDADGLAWLRREAFGFVFQQYNLLSTATAEENVEVPAIYAGLPHTERRERASELLTKLGLGERMDHRPSQLSGGQQQRVSIARALMNGGKVILADEPTGALDSQSGKEVMALLEELARNGHTVILITHDADVAAHADRVIEFRDGEVLSDSGYKSTQESSTISRQVDLSNIEESNSLPAMISGFTEALQMGLRSLMANVFRTVLTLLGIVIGVASVVAMLAIGEGAQQDVLDRISSLGVNMLTISPQNRGRSGRRGGASATLTIEDAQLVPNNISNVEYVLPEIRSNGTVRFGNLDYQTTITGTGENLPEARGWPLAEGVFFTEADSEEYAPVAVLGQTVVQSLLPDGGTIIGQYILIKSIPFQVIGVLTSKGSSGFGGRDQDDIIYAPLKTVGLRLSGQTYLSSMTVAVEDTNLINETEAELTAFLIARHGTEDFRVFNSAELIENVSESQKTFTILLGSVAAISLLVGGIGVMNIMLVSVTERTREIGVRMATGARQRDILQQFLAEAIVVTAVGGILGVAIGIGAGQLISLLGTTVKFTPQPIILAFSCAAATGLIFGYAPARKAAKLDPVVALASD